MRCKRATDDAFSIRWMVLIQAPVDQSKNCSFLLPCRKFAGYLGDKFGHPFQKHLLCASCHAWIMHSE